MKKLIILYLSIFFILPALVSCQDWFDVDNDDGDISGKQLLQSDEAFYQALAGIYTEMRKNSIYGRNMSIEMLEFMGQNFVPDNTLTRAMASFDYSALEKEKVISDLWKSMYNVISSVNYLIEEIEKTDVVFINIGQKEIITGELYGLRAALHFDLLRLFHPSYRSNPNFQGIPYMSDFGINVGSALSTSAVLQNIIDDLKYAAGQLEEYDPIITGQSPYTAKVGSVDSRLRTFQMNYYAVRAIQARVYLYMEEYQMAYDYAVEVFDQENLSRTSRVFYFFNPGTFSDDFSFSREHIFGISSLSTGLTTVSEELFEQREIRVSDKFEDVYPYAADTRFRTWFVLQEDNTYIMSRKYSRLSMLNDYVKTLTYSASLPVRIPFIKLGEVCLIAAEALNHLDEVGDAAEFIIKMQTNKGLTVVEDLENRGQLTKESLAQEIRNEYYREFWGEGQLFYFFKRMNDASIVSYDGSSIEMNDSKYTLPIPANGLSLNN